MVVAGCGYYLSVARHTGVVLARLRPSGTKVCCILYNVVLGVCCCIYCGLFNSTISSSDYKYLKPDGAMIVINELQKHRKGNFSIILYCMS